MRLILTIFTSFLFCFIMNARPVNVMLVTGGHSYDTLQFFQLFDSLDDVEYEHFVQPEANKAIAGGKARDFDVLMFYDMWQEISGKEKEAYINLTKQGKPLLFLHHALVSYQNWPEFEKLLGGKYIERSPEIPEEEQSTYRHDVWVDIEVVDNQHPVTKGFQDFRLFDEVYGNFRVLPEVTPLLKTSHAESSPVIGWENKYNASTIVYLQPGHDSNAFNSPLFRKIISQAIHYLSQASD